MKIRIHLRDTGSIQRRYKIEKWQYSFGYNIIVGRLFLAIRENDGTPHKRGKFLELKMGRAMRAEVLRWKKMTSEEILAENKARYEKVFPGKWDIDHGNT